MMKDFETFKSLQKKQKAYQLALGIASWDSNTEAPRACFPYRSDMLSVLSGELFSLQVSDEYRHVVNSLYEAPQELNELQWKEVEKAKKDLDKIANIPKEDYIEYAKLTNMAQKEWEKAKEDDDFERFKPYLEKIIAYKKKMLSYRAPEMHPYDVLLDDFEEGMDRETYDEFFDTVREEIVPFAKKILQKTSDSPGFLRNKFPKEAQREFVEYLMDVFAFDRNKGHLKESVHPFTWNTHSKDVRFTVRYLEDYVFSSVFAAIHELGHALYEQQVDEAFDMTNLKSGASMGIHESQSRFYENIIGRSLAFWETHLDAFKKRFPTQMKGVEVDDFYAAANRVEETFIRVEADELTYPLHILLRYEIERMIFDDEVTVEELPDVWNRKVKQYLNLDVEKDSDGILQDVHWSGGMMGYFPTYALGSAYAAQIYYAMKKSLDIEDAIRNDDIKAINEWLRDNIHCYGKSLKPYEILERVTQERFNPEYYVRYLKEKYTALYLEGGSYD